MVRPTNPLNEIIPDYETSTEQSETKTVAIEKEKVTDNMADPFPVDEFFRIEMDEEKIYDEETKKTTYKPVKREVYAPQNPKYSDKHLIKCRVRAARYFDVTFEHMEKAYEVLNGKKIDNIPISNIIDRFGWSDGTQTNRHDIGRKYDVSAYSVQVAQEKLKTIIRRKDLNTAYLEYVRQFEKEQAVDVIRNQTGF